MTKALFITWLCVKCWVVGLLTCSFLICSDAGKTSGYEGRSKTRSSASSCCWVKASALRCFRKLSTLPWESLFGPEPSEPSTRRKSNSLTPGSWPLLQAMYFKFPSCFMSFPWIFSVGETRRAEKDGLQVFPLFNGCSEPLATSLAFLCNPIHSSAADDLSALW